MTVKRPRGRAHHLSLTTLLTAGVSLLGVAYAQETPEAEEGEIVVTGTLFTNRNVVAPSPIISTTAEEIAESGTITLEAALNQVPAFAPAGTAGTAARVLAAM